jgi:putative hemolysin
MNGIHSLFLVLFFISLGFAAFFCSAETAFFSMQKVRVQHLIEKGSHRAKVVAKIMARPEKFLATVLLGINLFESLAATMGTIIAVSLWDENLGAVLATIIIALLTLVGAEYVPKSLAARYSEVFALNYAQPIVLISTIFSPVVFLLNKIGINLSRMPDGNSQPTVSEEELHTMITVGHREGTVEEEAAEMLHNVFEFGDRPVSEVMTSRAEVIFIEKGTPMTEFLKVFAENPLSQFPVFEENRDNIIGVLSIKDVLMYQAKEGISEGSIVDVLIRPAYFTPWNKPVSKLFGEMRDNNQRLAVVVDEFGGTSGVVTLYKLLEVIVGPMGDDMGGGEKDFDIIDDYTFQIDGGMRVEQANGELELGLPEGEYKTVAGFVLHLLQRIPRHGENLRYKNLKIIITKMHGVKIEEILVTREKPVQDSVRNSPEKDTDKTGTSS